MTRIGNLSGASRSVHLNRNSGRRQLSCARCVSLLCLEAAALWTRQNREILDRSRPACDLTDADIDYIVQVLNFDWVEAAAATDSTFHIEHNCLRFGCPLGCDGHRSRAKRHVRAATLLVAGGPMVVPLEYRWKGFEAAAAVACRARECCDLLRRALQGVFPMKKIAAATAAAEAANRQADADLDANTKTTIRAGTFLKWLLQDPMNKRLRIATMLNMPLQHFLNSALAAESAVSAVLRAVEMAPPGHDRPAGWAGLQQAAIDANLKLFSGARGEQAVHEISSLLLDFSSPTWQRLRLTDDEQWIASSSCLVACAEAWWRLVFRYKDSKYELLMVAQSPTYAELAVEAVVAPLLHAEDACSNCVDKYFTSQWAQRLIGCDAEKAHACLRDFVSSLRPTSKGCEQKHLLGQEVRGRRRGRVVSPFRLGLITYVKSVRQHSQALHRQVLASKLKTPRLRRNWALTMARFKLGTPQRGHNSRATRAYVHRLIKGPGKKRRRTGLDLYVREKMSEEIDDVGPFMKRARLARQWLALDRDSKEDYTARAQAMDDALDDRTLSYPEFEERPPVGLQRAAMKQAKRRAALHTLSELRGHPAWANGAGLAAWGTGLKPDLVLQGGADAMKRFCEESFSYEAQGELPSASPLKAFSTCRQRNWGVCDADAVCDLVNKASRNVYVHLLAEGIPRIGPWFVTFQVGEAHLSTEAHFLCRTFGKRGALIVPPGCESQRAAWHRRPALCTSDVATGRMRPFHFPAHLQEVVGEGENRVGGGSRGHCCDQHDSVEPRQSTRLAGEVRLRVDG